MSSDPARPPRDLEARTRALAEAAERARFAGASPRVELPPDAPLDEAAARILAAERLGLPLVIDGQVHHLHEGRAREALWAAQTALRNFSFGEAEARLDRAASLAVDPALQQRASLWKLLAALVRRLVRTPPDEAPRGDPARPALDLLDAADRLPAAERDHYRAEVRRLVEADATARRDPGSVERALWYVVRARLALAADEPLAALIWCVRLARAQAGHLPADPYLTDLLEKARLHVLLSLGDQVVPAEREGQGDGDDESGADADAAPAPAPIARDVAGLQAWDVYRALAIHLGAALGLDLQREAARLTIAPYRAADE